MSKLVLWAVENDKPARLADHSDYEKKLEDWIENDGSLVLDGIRWVGRQRRLPGGGILDLLGISREGEWVVAELKAGPLNMATLNQALGYAMEIGSLDGDELLRRLEPQKHSEVEPYLASRNVVLLLVGTSRAPDLDRGIRFLEERGLKVPIRVVTFGLFKQRDGTVLMARQVDDHEIADDVKTGPGIERVLDIAKNSGVHEEVNETIKIAARLGLPLKVWPACLTINSPANKRKTLLYVGPREGAWQLGYAADTYAEAFGVTEDDVRAALGLNWNVIPKADIAGWLRRAEDYTKAAQGRAAGASAAT